MVKKQKDVKKQTLILKRVLIASILAVIAVATFFFVRSILEKQTLLREGEQVMGVVEAKDVNITSSRTTGLTTRDITYSFTPKGSNEKVSQNSFYINRVDYEKYPLGSQIPITYLGGDPSVNQPTVSLKHVSSLAMSFMYLFLAITAAIFLGKFVKKFQQKRNIKSPGVPFYLTSLAGFIVAFAIAAVITMLITWLVNRSLI